MSDKQSPEAFARWLREEEREEGTVEKYLRDVGRLLAFLGDRPLTKEGLTAWKNQLLKKKFKIDQ